jgi:hypothetical protein
MMTLIKSLRPELHKSFGGSWRRTIVLALRTILPLTGVGALAGVGVYYLFRPKHKDPSELERQRRIYLNRVGRIVEGQIVEIVDEANALSRSPSADSPAVPVVASAVAAAASGSTSKAGTISIPIPKRERAEPPIANAAIALIADSSQRLLYYTYSISGVTYETSQDITGLEERIHLSRVAAGQTASVKYDPSNPSNSILLSDDWSGLH